MKEALKCVLCLMMALAMVFALAACGEDAGKDKPTEKQKETTVETTIPVETGETEPAETTETPETTEVTEETEPVEVEKTPELETTVVGQWTAEMDISAVASELILGFDLEYELEMEECVLIVHATFNEDGSAVWELDKDSLETVAEHIGDAMWNITVQMMAEQLGGVSFSAAEEVLIAQTGTKEEFLEAMMGDEPLEVEDLKAQWRLEGDQLYMITEDSEEEPTPMTIEFGYGTFSIVDGFAEDEESEAMMEAVLPIVFTRA